MYSSNLGYVPREVRNFCLKPLQAPININRWGFMVIFWNFSGVPFVSFPDNHWILIHSFEHYQSYVYSVVYMASHDPATYRFSTGGYIFIYAVLCTAYYMYVPFPFIDSFFLTLTWTVGIQPWHKRAALKCKPKESLNSARPSHNYPDA
jgi:hypothetical protein